MLKLDNVSCFLTAFDVKKQEAIVIKRSKQLNNNTIVVVEPIDVDTRLRQLGLALEPLHAALSRGLAAARDCTALHPRSAPGQYMFLETVVGLREHLASRGWRPYERQNMPLVVDSTGCRAIAVASADEGTGQHLFGNPRTRAEKGPHATIAIERNLDQTSFHGVGFDLPEQNTEAAGDFNGETWYLIHCIHERELRAELALPTGQEPSGRINTWMKRIILPAIPFDPDTPVVAPDFGPDLPVHVKRRA